MTSDIEIAKNERRNAWLRTLPQEVRLNTELTNDLCKALGDIAPARVASLLATCIKSRAWEAIAEYRDTGSSVVSYSPLQWCRECLRHEPDQLMRIVASPLPNPELGAKAAIELVKMVKEYEPFTLNTLIDPQDPRNWRALLKANEQREGGPWIEAAAELDRETKREAGDNQYRGRTGPALPEGATRAPEGTRDGIRRRLEKYAKDPEACLAKGTTQERVKKSLRDFLAGSPAQQCLRESGLASSNQEKGSRIRINGSAIDIAQRIISYLGKVNSIALANAIIQLASNLGESNVEKK